MTLFLWDASDFDWGRGPMDLTAAKADGITGFSHKATEGTSVRHTHTGEALSRARNAGFEFIGAYHVVRSVNVSAQVDYFLSYLDQAAPWWRTFPGFFLQVDLELWPYDQVSASHRQGVRVRAGGRPAQARHHVRQPRPVRQQPRRHHHPAVERGLRQRPGGPLSGRLPGRRLLELGPVLRLDARVLAVRVADDHRHPADL